MDNDQILDSEFGTDEERIEVEFVDANKFIILDVLSLGLYGVWWMYKAWRFLKEKDSLDVMPVWRAIFGILFLYSLAERILDDARSKGYSQSYSSGGLLVGFIIFNLLARLPDPYWLISIATFLFLVPPVRALNYAIENSDIYALKQENGFNSRQIIILILGGLFWLLIILGLLVPA